MIDLLNMKGFEKQSYSHTFKIFIIGLPPPPAPGAGFLFYFKVLNKRVKGKSQFGRIIIKS